MQIFLFLFISKLFLDFQIHSFSIRSMLQSKTKTICPAAKKLTRGHHITSSRTRTKVLDSSFRQGSKARKGLSDQTTNSDFCLANFTNFLNKINHIVPYWSCGRSNPLPISFPLGIFTHKSIRPQTLLLGPSFNDYNSTIIWGKLMNRGS